MKTKTYNEATMMLLLDMMDDVLGATTEHLHRCKSEGAKDINNLACAVWRVTRDIVLGGVSVESEDAGRAILHRVNKATQVRNELGRIEDLADKLWMPKTPGSETAKQAYAADLTARRDNLLAALTSICEKTKADFGVQV
jgi:hypothetical protein